MILCTQNGGVEPAESIAIVGISAKEKQRPTLNSLILKTWEPLQLGYLIELKWMELNGLQRLL